MSFDRFRDTTTASAKQISSRVADTSKLAKVYTKAKTCVPLIHLDDACVFAWQLKWSPYLSCYREEIGQMCRRILRCGLRLAYSPETMDLLCLPLDTLMTLHDEYKVKVSHKRLEALYEIEYPADEPPSAWVMFTVARYAFACNDAKARTFFVQIMRVMNDLVGKEYVGKKIQGNTLLAMMQAYKAYPGKSEHVERWYEDILLHVASQPTRLILSNQAQQNPTRPSIADYQPLVRFIAKGGYGSVYAVKRTSQVVSFQSMARGENENTVYALKELRLTDPYAFLDMMRERNVLMLLRHPNLVRGHRMFMCGPVGYLEMEYAPYGTLSDVRLGDESRALPYARHILSQIIPAVEHLHSYGIVHHDIKFNNVLIFAGGVLKLSDMGLCMQSKNTRSTTFDMSSTIQEVYKSKGTIYAPEIYVDEYTKHTNGTMTLHDSVMVDYWGLAQLMYTYDPYAATYATSNSHDSIEYEAMYLYFNTGFMLNPRFQPRTPWPVKSSNFSSPEAGEFMQAIREMLTTTNRSMDAMKRWVANHPTPTFSFSPADLPNAAVTVNPVMAQPLVPPTDPLPQWMGTFDLQNTTFTEDLNELVDLTSEEKKRLILIL